MEKFIDKFWQQNVTRKEEIEERKLSIYEVDHIIHDLIHQLLLMAEEDKTEVHRVH